MKFVPYALSVPEQCGDDKEGIDRLVASGSESYTRNSTPNGPKVVR